MKSTTIFTRSKLHLLAVPLIHQRALRIAISAIDSDVEDFDFRYQPSFHKVTLCDSSPRFRNLRKKHFLRLASSDLRQRQNVKPMSVQVETNALPESNEAASLHRYLELSHSDGYDRNAALAEMTIYTTPHAKY